MRLLSILFVAAAAANAATTYTATNLQPAGSPYQVANVWGLNNHGQVLVDICANGSCYGVNRFAGVWSDGVITPLPIPTGCTYSPEAGKWGINDSGTVYGWVGCGSLSKVAVWTSGVPNILPDAPLVGSSGICTANSAYISASRLQYSLWNQRGWPHYRIDQLSVEYAWRTVVLGGLGVQRRNVPDP